MDEIVLQAMAKWPNVPAVYGWLALDRRGNWLIKRETISNETLNAYISRNYQHDDTGRWFFQNGPQRVFVDLDYTPFVYRAINAPKQPLALITHTGAAVHAVQEAHIDEQGAVLLQTDFGIGIVHDQDLDPLLLAAIIDVNGNAIEEAAFDELLEIIEHQQPIPLWLRFGDSNVRLEPINSAEVPERFGFDPHPAAPPPPLS